MCTKTKTSYGCGHALKALDSCGDSTCTSVEKYHFKKDVDCPTCRSGGTSVTRGKDGRGYYGKLHRSEETSAGSPPSPSRQHRPNKIDLDGRSGPWSPEEARTKPWDSPIRRSADDAWLNEHDARMAGLQELVEKYSISSKSSRNGSPHTSNERIAIHTDEQPFPHKLRYAKTMPLPYEVQAVDEESDPYRHRRSRRARKQSHKSEDSMKDYVESPSIRYRKTDLAESSSEQDHYGVRRHRGAKTEPHPYARSYLYDTPLSASPVDRGHHFDQYEVIQTPQYGYVYPRGYR